MSRVFLALLLAGSSTFALWAAGCGSDESALGELPGDDDSAEPDTGAAECPALGPADLGPEEGAYCTQPEGTTCALGPCADTYLTCRGGRWAKSSTSPPKPLCPAQAPAEGDECPRCFPTYLLCAFGCDGDAGQSAVRAVCSETGSGGLVWQLSPRECPAFDAGAADADPQDGS